MNDRFGMDLGFFSGGFQRMTLEQWNFQKRMQALHERKPAGVFCECGSEMVEHKAHDEFNLYSPLNTSPGIIPNVQCPKCQKVGRKL